MRPALSSLTAVLLALVACSCAWDRGEAQQDPSGPSSVYVALGDSYSSAPLNPDVADEQCLRSTRNYASRLARALSVQLTDATCAGAQTADVRAAQDLPEGRGGGSVPPQIDAVGRQTELVTIGLGGNDGGLFTAIVRGCLAAGSDSAGCVRALERSGERSDFRRTGEAIAAVVEDVRRRAADGVAIVLVDYPRIVDSARPCPPLPGVEQESLAAVANAQRQLNRTLAQAAADSGAVFLDLEETSQTHDLCSADPWVNDGVTKPGIAARWHPLPQEQAAVARLLEGLLVDRGLAPTG